MTDRAANPRHRRAERHQQEGDAARALSDAGDKTADAAVAARDSKPFRVLVAVGLIAYGLIHLTVGWIAVQLAWSGHSQASADQQGALRALASKPLGPLWLLSVAVGLFALVWWRLGLAAWGFAWKQGWRRTTKRLGSVGQALIYGGLGVNAVLIVIGAGSGGGRHPSATARLMQQTSGQVLLVLLGAAIVGGGGYLCVRGIRKTFTDELQDGGTRPVVVVGRIGYIAKGLAYVTLGVIIGWAALRHQSPKSAGLDMALRTLREQPFGPVLLTALAVGFSCFGLFCFGWARRARRS